MADRLKSWEKRELDDPAFERVAGEIAEAKCKIITPAVAAAYCSKMKVAASPADRAAIATRANELLACQFAVEGRPARSGRRS